MDHISVTEGHFEDVFFLRLNVFFFDYVFLVFNDHKNSWNSFPKSYNLKVDAACKINFSMES